jgi:hypothetical protein
MILYIVADFFKTDLVNLECLSTNLPKLCMDGSGHKNDLKTKTEKKNWQLKLKGLKVLWQSRDNLAASAFLHLALSKGVKNRTWGCLKNIHIPAYSINSGDYLSCTHTTKLSDVDFWPGFKCGEHVRALEPPKVSTLTAAAREGCFFFFRFFRIQCELRTECLRSKSKHSLCFFRRWDKVNSTRY